MADQADGLPPLARLALTVSRFRDMDATQTVAAVATDDGKAAHLRYGDLRTLLAEALAASERLGRIADWHSRETGPHGMFGDYCAECGERWPCDTRRMADGTYSERES